MKIALIGYGKMGKEIEALAKERGHDVPLIIDIDNADDLNPANLEEVDVAIEFTVPDAAVDNYKKCFDSGVPVITGTTGWLDKYDEVVRECQEANTSFFYAPNFSLGVNVFFKVNSYLAKIMNKLNDYEVDITEVHHTQKLDAPSGTAIHLANDIVSLMDRKKRWELDGAKEDDNISIKAVRENKVPGIHTIHYESPVDNIEITHSAKSRKGFVMGAVLASEFIAKQNPGIYSMDDLLEI